MADEKKRPTIAGTQVPLYLEEAFVNKTKSGKSLISVVARKRRDVDPKAAYAGGYVTNQEVEGKKGKFVSHSQIFNRTSLNKILEGNGREPMTQEAIDKLAGNGKPLFQGKDNLAFDANVFSDQDKNHHGPNGQWTHVVGQNSIQAPAKPFDYSVEHQLNQDARSAKSAPEAKAAEAPAKQADGPEM